MALEHDVFGVATALASVASIPISYGLFRMAWALGPGQRPAAEEGPGRIYRLSDRRRRERLGLVCVLVGLGLTLAGMTLIAAPWGSDPDTLGFSGLGFLLIVCVGAIVIRWRWRKDRAIGLIIDADSVSLLPPKGQERLPRSQLAGVALVEGRTVALEGSALPWLQQIGELVLKSSDPDASPLRLPAGLAVDAAFDDWIAGLPVLESPLLEARGEMTVRDAGAFAVVRRFSARSRYVRTGLGALLILVLCAQLLLSLDNQGFSNATLLALGAARVDLVWESEEWFRLISAAFLHRDPGHFGRCVPLLLIVAAYLERRAGSLQLLLVFLVCAAVSTAASLYLAPPDFITAGVSGAMFGVFGFYLAGHVRPHTTSVNTGALFLLSLGTLAAALPPGQLPFPTHDYFGPDHGGNLAGLIAGVIAALALAMIPRRAPGS